MNDIKIGIIGGSGLYELPGTKVIEHIAIKTPFGKPSDKYTVIDVDGVRAAFLPRHSRGHVINPSELPSRANIYGFKMLGVDRIIAISAVGSLKEEIAPEHFVIPDQIIDRTRGRVGTFYEDGAVAHVSFADPFCEKLSALIAVPLQAALNERLHKKGTYICMEGPAFSTRAESTLYRSWGASIIGMTAIPEAKLAREAEICYSMVAMSTDYDCWKVEEHPVTVEMVIGHMNNNTEIVKKCLPAMIKQASLLNHCEHHESMKFALISNKTLIPNRTKKKLAPLIGKYL